MTDLNKLEKWIEDHGLVHRFVAQKIGIAPSAFSRKINGNRKFTAKEIAKFQDIGMSRKEIFDIFFADEVS